MRFDHATALAHRCDGLLLVHLQCFLCGGHGEGQAIAKTSIGCHTELCTSGYLNLLSMAYEGKGRIHRIQVHHQFCHQQREKTVSLFTFQTNERTTQVLMSNIRLTYRLCDIRSVPTIHHRRPLLSCTTRAPPMWSMLRPTGWVLHYCRPLVVDSSSMLSLCLWEWSWHPDYRPSSPWSMSLSYRPNPYYFGWSSRPSFVNEVDKSLFWFDLKLFAYSRWFWNFFWSMNKTERNI